MSTDLVTRIVEATKANKGYTVSLQGEEPTNGYALSIFSEYEKVISEITDKEIEDYLTTYSSILSENGNFIGTWDSGHGIYLDISLVVADKAVAEKLSREHTQLAYFDLANLEEITL